MTNKLIGYARAETSDPTNRRQIGDLVRFGVPLETIYTDAARGRTMNRPGWLACLAALRKDDLLIVRSLDRLGRDLIELVRTIKTLMDRGIHIKALNHDIDTTTANGMIVAGVVMRMAHWEHRLISERIATGMASIQSGGKRLGRRPKITDQEVQEAIARINEGEVADVVAAAYGVSRQTIYRKFDEIRKVTLTAGQ